MKQTDRRPAGVFDDQLATGMEHEMALADYLVQKDDHMVFRGVGAAYPMDLLLINKKTGTVTAIDVKYRRYGPDFFAENMPVFRAEHIHKLWLTAILSKISQAVVMVLNDGSAWYWEIPEAVNDLDSLSSGPDGLQDVPHYAVPWSEFRMIKRPDDDMGLASVG